MVRARWRLPSACSRCSNGAGIDPNAVLREIRLPHEDMPAWDGIVLDAKAFLGRIGVAPHWLQERPPRSVRGRTFAQIDVVPPAVSEFTR